MKLSAANREFSIRAVRRMRTIEAGVVHQHSDGEWIDGNDLRRFYQWQRWKMLALAHER